MKDMDKPAGDVALWLARRQKGGTLGRQVRTTLTISPYQNHELIIERVTEPPRMPV